MKFGKTFAKNRIPEWKSKYMDYIKLKKILKKVNKIAKQKFFIQYSQKNITNMEESETKKIQTLKLEFEKQIYKEFKKFQESFVFMHYFKIYENFAKVLVNFDLLKQDATRLKQSLYIKKNIKMKNSIERFYKLIVYVKEFFNMNFRVIYKISKKYKKIFKKIGMYDKSFLVDFNQHVLSQGLLRLYKEIESIQIQTKRLYNKKFKSFTKFPIINLEWIEKRKELSATSIFNYGFFLGIAIFAIFLSIWCLFEFKSLKNNPFVEIYWPIFRGTFLFNAYTWFIALNIYVWDKYNVNYKYVFDIQVHYSNMREILIRATVFSIIWLFIFLWTIIGLNFNGNTHLLFNFIEPMWFPPITWLVYIIYYLFPSKKYFNGKTRYFLQVLVLEMFKSPFKDFNFIIPWATDQFLSFAVSLRDFFYTSCYCVHIISKKSVDNMACTDNIVVRIGEMIVVFAPLALRMGQCLNRMYFAGNSYGKKKNFANFMKYFVSTLTVIFSLIIPLQGEFLYVWIVFLGLSTVYSYFWDVKYDFGFIEFHKVNGKHKINFLRSKRSYPNTCFYIFVIFFNFILRISFILSLSQNKLTFIHPILIITFISLLEIYRRAQWNFLRVEFEHIKLLKNFDPINGFALPYPVSLEPKNKNDSDTHHFVSSLVTNVIDQKEKNLDVLMKNDDVNIKPHLEAYKLQLFQTELPNEKIVISENHLLKIKKRFHQYKSSRKLIKSFSLKNDRSKRSILSSEEKFLIEKDENEESREYENIKNETKSVKITVKNFDFSDNEEISKPRNQPR